MLYLLLSILFSTSLVIILRLFERWKIDTRYGIVFNYLVCVITGLTAMEDIAQLQQIATWNGWAACLLLGVGFILIFNLIGKSTQLLGVATTSIAFKLSFIIPVIVAVLFYGDQLTFFKIAGIAAGIAAVYFITYQKEATTEKNKLQKGLAWLPVLIFVGSGITDSCFNYIQRHLTPPGFDHIVTVMVFLGAFLSGMVMYGRNKELYSLRNIAGGIVLGVPNYGSLYFLLKALQESPFPPSTLFPVNNLGIVCVAAFVGLLFFRESVNRRKIIGFVLAVSSIVLIGFLDR